MSPLIVLAAIAIGADGRAERFGFSFTAGAFREEEIFDSANCSPSRYLVEIARRVLPAAPWAERLVIGNPLLPLTPAQLAGWIPSDRTVPVVVTDARQFPLAYSLPRRLLAESERFLLMLSTCDGAIDQSLLALLNGDEAGLAAVPGLEIGNFPNSTVTGWFMGAGRQQMLRLLSAGAVHAIERNSNWRDLPFAAYLPYHAGSLLFFNLASRQVPDGFFQRAIFCHSYRDIHHAFPGRQEPIWLRLPWLPRDNSVGELEYLVHGLERLGDEVVDNHFIGFMRYSRGYSATPFHLADQMKFALGHPMRHEADTIHNGAPNASAKADLPVRPLRLLFHLAGGWKLKSYRDDLAAAVFLALKGMGCEITVIDRPDLAPLGVRSVISDDTALLTAETRAHHIFIGVDSFPHHFVRHALGWPVIGLFANTKPCNSDAREGADYRALVAHLPCNPCGGHDQCPILGREDCANFSPPHQVVSAIVEMASAIYGFAA